QRHAGQQRDHGGVADGGRPDLPEGEGLVGAGAGPVPLAVQPVVAPANRQLACPDGGQGPQGAPAPAGGQREKAGGGGDDRRRLRVAAPKQPPGGDQAGLGSEAGSFGCRAQASSMASVSFCAVANPIAPTAAAPTRNGGHVSPIASGRLWSESESAPTAVGAQESPKRWPTNSESVIAEARIDGTTMFCTSA